MEKTLHQKSIIVNKHIKLLYNKAFVFCLVFILANLQLNAQNCNPDTEAPTIYCIVGLQADFQEGNPILQIWGSDLDGGTFDNCAETEDLEFRIQLSEDFDDNVPNTQSLSFVTGPQLVEVAVWAGDLAGNWDYCYTTIEISCESDMVEPIAICEDQISINESGTQTEINVSDLDEGSYDNCSEVIMALTLSENYDQENPPTASSLTLDNSQASYIVVLSVQDESGNENACWSTVQVNWGNCENDETPPTPYCLAGLQLDGQLPGFEVDIWGVDYDVASFDNCTAQENLIFRIQRESDFTGTPPETPFITITEADPETQVVHMWVGDESGNWDYCSATLSVATCEGDAVAPIAICDDGLSFVVDESDEFLLLADEIDEGSYDNCSDVTLAIGFLGDFDQYNPPTAQELLLTNVAAQFDVVLVVTDASGNQNFCYSTVNVDWGCTEDDMAPQFGCPGSISYLNQNNLPNLKLWAEDLATDAVDNCTLSENLSYSIEFSSDFAENDPPTDDYLALGELLTGSYPVIVWVGDESGNWDYCESILYYSTTPTLMKVTGYVFSDTLSNCVLDAGEEGISGRAIYLRNLQSGIVHITETDFLGYYEVTDTFYHLQPTMYELGVLNTPGSGLDCEMTVTYDVSPGTTSEFDHDFGFGFEQEDPYCPTLAVDIGASTLRHCFENQYHVYYCNNSLTEVQDVYVEVDLDEWLELTGSSIPNVNVEGNLYRFDIGILAPLDCGSFTIDVFVSCEAEFGLTHCSEAHIFPDDPCEEPDDIWSGAIIEVSGFCDDGGVHMVIENVGTANMPVPRNYIVVEDVVMFSSAPFQLDAGMDMQIDFPANGSTWRLEAEQEPGYPGYSPNAVAVEGCGGLDMTGLVNIFDFNDEPGFVSVDCQPNVSSYDPNDKQAFPTGYGNANFIETNTEIEYMIRFQNTGTAPAFKVVLLDTLSEYLDPATLQPGSSSHPYRAELLEGNVLKFSFDDIILPDSTTNEPASHGFAKFKINQLPDNPKGTVILNRAGIYFDANPVVMTNTVMHTIGDHFVTVSSGEVLLPEVKITVYPNPYHEETTFYIEGVESENGELLLFNRLGQLIQSKSFEGKQVNLESRQLPSGLYYYKLNINGQLVNSGKIVKE